MAEKGLPLPKFGEWDVNDPASAEGFTVIFNKARNEKRTGGETGETDLPSKEDSTFKHKTTLGKPQSSPEGTGENYSSRLHHDVFQKTGAAVEL